MDVIISENQEDRLKSIIKEIVEDVNVPLAIKVDVEINKNGNIYILIVLKNYLMSNARTKYESLIRNKIKNYIGLNVDVIMLEKSTIDS